jgi:galactose mutarotase-like enzyme
MKHTISNGTIRFVSDSYNVEPWFLGFADENINYFWHTPEGEKLGTAVCFPQLGTMPDNSYVYDGKVYSMPMHGFAQDREFAVAEKSETHVAYELLDDDASYKMFPWHFRFQVIHSVEGAALKTEYLIENRDDKELYFSVGGNQRYTCPIGEGTVFEDYAIEFEKPEYIKNIAKAYSPISAIEKCLSPDGKNLRLDYSMFSGGCFCFRPYNSKEITLKNNKNKRGIRIQLGGAENLQFWTSPGSPLLAIEPFYGAISSQPMIKEDGDWINKPGILRLNPAGVYRCGFTAHLLR